MDAFVLQSSQSFFLIMLDYLADKCPTPISHLLTNGAAFYGRWTNPVARLFGCRSMASWKLLGAYHVVVKVRHGGQHPLRSAVSRPCHLRLKHCDVVFATIACSCIITCRVLIPLKARLNASRLAHPASAQFTQTRSLGRPLPAASC